eukprot:CAMPEP_0202062854 /NCGR_PEP_ID=MMETSP0963-20130614/44959_1 /ASSEMBLY_ACC=CAM_ASM_000494 /TAXON_ID=4773 /ORGANISM="Schizochytrium aggregatum, Strain ATCC28209" /LENGTH=34 /DNA_ID= /DNA_START= /DNA_END= /DNA_ORIENTATION=
MSPSQEGCEGEAGGSVDSGWQTRRKKNTTDFLYA